MDAAVSSPRYNLGDTSHCCMANYVSPFSPLSLAGSRCGLVAEGLNHYVHTVVSRHGMADRIEAAEWYSRQLSGTGQSAHCRRPRLFLQIHVPHILNRMTQKPLAQSAKLRHRIGGEKLDPRRHAPFFSTCLRGN